MEIGDSLAEQCEIAYKLAGFDLSKSELSKRIELRWIMTLDVPEKRGFAMVKGKKEGLTVRKMNK